MQLDDVITAAFYAGGTASGFIETGDFTGDGSRDLVLISGSDEIDVLPGLGDGSFGPPLQHITDIYGASAAAVGLFDAGSKLDVAIAFYDGIRVFPGDGAGSFGDPILTPTSGFQPYALVAADFNGDGHLDLALSNGGGLVYIFLGNGDGTFTQELALTAPAGSISLSVGTLDPGGTLDLVASGPGGVTYWSGLGNGNFGPPQVLSLGGTVATNVVADFNGDGFADIGVAVDAYVAVFLNDGDGTFQAAIEYPTGFTGSRMAAADVDGDGLTDLVVLQGQYSQQTARSRSSCRNRTDHSTRPEASAQDWARSISRPRTSTETASKTWRPRVRSATPQSSSALAAASCRHFALHPSR